MKRVFVIMKHKIVKKVLSYVVAISVGSLMFAYLQYRAKQGAYAEFKAQHVNMDCYPTRKHKGDEA